MSKKEKKEKKLSFEDGYVSFSSEQLHEDAAKDKSNSEAYEWLDRAMTTSSNVTKKSKKGDAITIDDVYPVTAEETAEMSQCLDKAKEVAGDPSDPIFKERLSELRSIVEWSSKRHSTFQWSLIGGVAIILAIVFFMMSDAAGDVDTAKANKAKVESWTKVADTTIVYDVITEAKYGDRLKDANNYKHYTLFKLKSGAESAKNSQQKYLQYADTASTKDRKKSYLKTAKDSEERAEQNLKEYKEVNDMNYRQMSKYAKGKMKKSLSSARAGVRSVFVVMLFFIVLIPLYVFSQRPYGYTITRMRLESKVVGWIQKIAFGLAGGMATGAMMLSFMPVTVTKWSDGTTTRDSASEAANAMIMAIKVMLMIFAVMIFCGVSFMLMIYLTVTGLRRNYNWTEIKADVMGRISKE